MIPCPSCAAENQDASKFCSECGSALKPEYEPTMTYSAADGGTDSGTSSDSSIHGRFVPGTKLANRYRIVSLVGKGGMGEVYRADDLKLGQTVALKFLPKDLANDPKRLEYFHSEVRLTRQISHPNVCRVYDIGEVDGEQFLSMEFIDGEDLKSLLRRIGKLPKDKGIQIAHQLCAGLAAAHAKGVLHRDLKPANIMIDGQGQVRITDFGLARLSTDASDAHRVGTPAYMAPEQLAEGETSVRSDIYSLGLILYEMFTGERAIKGSSALEIRKQQPESTTSDLLDTMRDVDPAVEQVIQRCLHKNAGQRLKSALSVTAALPGGDPLAAAQAAGETPSPEMVLAAEEGGGIHPLIAGICISTVVVAVIVAFFMDSQFTALGCTSLPKQAHELAKDVEEVIRSFGYEDSTARDMAYGFEYDEPLIKHLEQHGDTPLQRALADRDLSLLYFWYRLRWSDDFCAKPVSQNCLAILELIAFSDQDASSTFGERYGERNVRRIARPGRGRSVPPAALHEFRAN
jgi:serine/threonine-protein kinase